MTTLASSQRRRDSTVERPRAERVVRGLLESMTLGSVEVQGVDGSIAHYGQSGDSGSPRAAIALHDNTVFARVLASGDIGLAESYFDKGWDSPDLVALLEVMMRNREVLERVVYGGFWGSLVHRVSHALRRNTRTGSRRNISAHYDLGNDFYRLWLDPTMSYSSAWFRPGVDDDLPAAQHAKIDRALDEAGVVPGAHVLEIGCGWGTFALRAARERSAHVTGVTLSREQLDWAMREAAQRPEGARCDFRLCDYRDLGNEANFVPFDAVVSIEMFEAVGREYWSDYFDTLSRCLAPGGRACVQSITIRDDLFERYSRSSDFIQQHVFPGGMLPSPSVFRELARRHGFEVVTQFDFGADYARTLRHWREAFQRAIPQVRALGHDERFCRLWEFYLAYCEAAFATGNTEVSQFTLRHAR
jgi:cyclopropane-fatty-acyl-phospholipid synthase